MKSTKLDEIAARLELRVLNEAADPNADVTGGYVSDMLSDVLAHGGPNCLWITRQSHQNVIAVASLLGLAGVVLVNCTEPDPQLTRKASEEGIALFIGDAPAFDLAGRLYEMGLRGCKRA